MCKSQVRHWGVQNSKLMEVGKKETESKTYAIKECVSKKAKALVSHERILKYYTAGNCQAENILMILIY